MSKQLQHVEAAAACRSGCSALTLPKTGTPYYRRWRQAAGDNQRLVVPVRVDVSRCEPQRRLDMEGDGLWTLDVLRQYSIEPLKDMPLGCYHGAELVRAAACCRLLQRVSAR
jgi:hypothetical protein